MRYLLIFNNYGRILFDFILFRVGVAKFDTTREPDMTNPFINRSWIEPKRVRVIFGLTRLTRLINGSCSCLTCLTHLTRLT